LVTFLMVFLIQNTQNRDSKAIHLKLDELLKGVRGARNYMSNVEDLSDHEMDELHDEFKKINERYVKALVKKGKSKEEILDEMYDKYVEVEKLKNKLRRYENPHTPPSKEARKDIMVSGILTIALVGTFMIFHLDQLESLQKVNSGYSSMKESIFDTLMPTLIILSPILAIGVISFRNMEKDMTVVWMVPVAVTLIYFITTLPNYIFYNQYLTVIVPFLALAVGRLAESLEKKVLQVAMGVFIVVNMLNSFSLIKYPLDPIFLWATPDWRPGSQYLKMNADEGEKILATQHAAIWFYMEKKHGMVTKLNNLNELTTKLVTSENIVIENTATNEDVAGILGNYEYILYFNAETRIPAWTLYLSDNVRMAIESQAYRSNYYNSTPYYVSVYKNRLVK